MQKKNPLLIVLAVCGGCVLLGIIALVVITATVAHRGGPMITGFAKMTKNMPGFMLDLQSKNYSGAAALTDPSASPLLSADKIQHMEEAVEKKLGPLQSFSPAPALVSSDTQSASTGGGTTIVYVYQYTLTYQKGTAKADLKFKLQNVPGASGLISGFSLEPTGQKQGQ